MASTGGCEESTPMKQYFIYIMSNKPNGTLYIGITSSLIKRVYEHRCALQDGFTKKYGLKRLVYYEECLDVLSAIQREKNLKKWIRDWKIKLIEDKNPLWSDLWLEISH